jgi:8-oxo-dGTP pyrophosphatase MutT (NUDIX family)
MRKTAGLLVMYQGAILLVQQRHDNNKSRLSIPKGGIIQGEDSLNAAIRETWEETGIYVPIININPKPYILNINSQQLQRRIIYYIATFPDSYELPTINVRSSVFRAL